MRLAIKSAAAALVVYVILLAGLAYWMDQQRRSLARNLMEGTARLLGGEIASLISDSAAQELLTTDSGARERLEQLILDLTSRSEVVASVTVVNAAGQVVASKDLEPGRQLAIPDMIFQGDKRPQFLSSEAPLSGSKYHLFVPLMQADTIIGYLRLSIGSARIESLYSRAQRQLIVVGAVGLGFVAALGFLFHVQLSRLADTLTRGLQAAVRGEAIPRRSHTEFAGALDAARRVGEELSAAREKTADAERRFGALMKVMETGLLLVGPEHTLDFANDAARELLGCPAPGELERRWPEARLPLERRGADLHGHAAPVDLDIPGDGRENHLRLEFYPRGEAAAEGWLILVKNREVLNALEKELRLAIQMRGFAQFYRASVHDLRAPLNAMVLNLELLKGALSSNAAESSDPEILERQTRFIKVLGEEIARLDRSLRTVLAQATPPSDNLEQFDLRQVIDDLATLLGPQARHQRVTLTQQQPEHAVPFTGHRDGLKQALLNIAINALESMPNGGSMKIDLVVQDGRAAISIRDTGPGIPPEALGEIYKMHFTTKDGGTGIGLYVARSVVGSHGGELHVETEIGRGTCFHVDLPISSV